MNMTVPERGMTGLRRTAEAAEEATGLRAEIIRGVLMMSPTPRGKHAKVVNVVERQLLPVLPDGLDAFQLASVALPHDPDDYATPDLLVCDAAFGDSDDWLAEPGSSVLAVEVVSRGSATKDTRDMVSWYAEADVPAYLVIDPRQGHWTLHTVPKGGAYQGSLRGEYGEEVPLELEGLRTKLATEGLPRYGPERRQG
ncbi:Uma2 family endonuclease [Streptomyces spirodelae]|uniref:Uma2 family endonuclease n=1 Tax=Streptomyces spirodelae TaxID=2812904 RepID=A0ABS3WZF7_9ACTN|nr:Uma2 family endonuclease [Streptomyces spirodelae]MBO8188502.1 Uma2 family endonuclease [Streptomyces spirodelae]